MRSKELRAKRAKMVADARAIVDSATGDTALTAEQQAEFDKIMAAADGVKAEIDRVESLEKTEADLGTRIASRAAREGVSADEAKGRTDREKAAYSHFVRYGMHNMPDDLRTIANSSFRAPTGPANINNALSTGVDTAGGYIVPTDYSAQIVEAQLAFGGMIEVADVITTSTGVDMPIPTDDDTSNEGEIVGQNNVVSQGDVTFGAVTLRAYDFSSKLIRVPMALLQDASFDLETYLRRKFATRLARAENRYLTVGTGASQPMGVMASTTAGLTAASATDITPDEIIALKHSVDPAYRTGARFMMNDATLKALKTKKDGVGRYIWASGLAVREPDTIDGFPYTINQHMVDAATGTKPIAFGNFKNYMVRRVAGVRVLRLTERFADYNQVGFLAFQRLDGQLVDAGTHPIKHILMA